jgi:hypothetical protein
LSSASAFSTYGNATMEGDLKKKALNDFVPPPSECHLDSEFDLTKGDTWIYPINMPKRDYQFNIIQKGFFLFSFLFIIYHFYYLKIK